MTASWPGWLGVVGGIWLILAPFILNYSNIDNALWNDIIVGAAAILLTGFCALTALRLETSQMRLIAGGLSILAGVWLIIAPFLLNYSNIENALWNDIITGALFIIVGIYAVVYHRPRFARV
jgi:hypothetical protein